MLETLLSLTSLRPKGPDHDETLSGHLGVDCVDRCEGGRGDVRWVVEECDRWCKCVNEVELFPM